MSLTNNIDILDVSLADSMQDLMAKEEKVIWEGNPIRRVSAAFLESKASYDPIGGFHSPLGTVLGLSFLAITYFYAYNNWSGIIITVIISIITLLVPEIVKRRRRKYTSYLVTDRRIYFSLWNWGKGQIEFLNFEDIGQINLATYEKGVGTIYFFTALDTRIKTYDFEKGHQRHCPTFEIIPKAEELAKEINDLRMQRIRALKHLA